MSNWHQDLMQPPWRTPTNKERRATWAAKYYLIYRPYMHPTEITKEPAYRPLIRGFIEENL